VRERYGDGWKEAPAPAYGGAYPPVLPGSRPASFAEAASPAPTAADILAGQLGDGGDGVLAGWMDRIKLMVAAASSPEQLRANIEAAWGELPTEQLARLIELTLTAATLAGIYDANNAAAGARRYG
jgi:hypothetical protein